MKKLIFSVSVFAAVLLSFLPLAAQTTISSSGNVTGAAEGVNDVSATLKDTDGRRIVSATASGYSGKTGEVVNDAMAKTGDAQRSVPQYLSYTLILSGEIASNKGGGEGAGEGGPETYSATRLEKGEFYIDQSEKYIAQGKTAKFTARRTNDKTPIPVEWKITTKDGIQVQPTTGTISATEITTLSTLTAQRNSLTVTYNRQAIDMTSYYEKIITHESNFQQFNDRGTYSGEPNYGAPNGWGIAQIDNGTGNYNTNYMWNWHENLQAGISIFAGKVGGINDRIRWIRNEYPDLPPLTDEQFIRAMIIAYNGFRGTHQVRTGYDDFGNPTYISFCYEPISRNQWGNFRDNENNYYSVIANTSVP